MKPASTPGAPVQRNARSALWDRYTRHVLASYGRHISIVTIALLSISLTTDIASWVWKTMSSNTHDGWWRLTYLIGRIFVLRSTDLLSQILPIACFLGVLWAESSQTWTRERTTIWNTGRSPTQCILPAVLLAAGLTFVQFALDAYLRPAAVMTMEERFPGKRPDGTQVFSANKSWIVAGNDLINAQISAGPPAAMRNVTMYRLSDSRRVREIVTAEYASPGEAPHKWNFRNVKTWRSDSVVDSEASPNAAFEQLELAVQLPAVSLTVRGIHPQFLPFHYLRELSALRNAPSSIAPYRTWYHSRFARALFPGGMVLLAASLSLLLLAYSVRAGVVIAIALAGYAAHIMIRIFTVFGEHDKLNPLVAAWATPILLILASVAAILILQTRWSYRLAAR